MPTPLSVSVLASFGFSKAMRNQSHHKMEEQVDLAIRQRALEAANSEYRRVVREMKYEVERKIPSK